MKGFGMINCDEKIIGQKLILTEVYDSEHIMDGFGHVRKGNNFNL